MENTWDGIIMFDKIKEYDADGGCAEYD
jgi:hypothetical protein